MEKTFAVIEDGIVVNIIVGVEDEVVAANPTKYVEYTRDNHAYIGLGYDGSKFEQPTPIEIPEEQ
jgi:hypothetical protein